LGSGMGKAGGLAVVGCGIDDGGVVPGAAKMPNADLQTVVRTVSRLRPVARTPFPGAFAASTAQPRVFGPSFETIENRSSENSSAEMCRAGSHPRRVGCS
jgi:hypothetical protein